MRLIQFREHYCLDKYKDDENAKKMTDKVLEITRRLIKDAEYSEKVAIEVLRIILKLREVRLVDEAEDIYNELLEKVDKNRLETIFWDWKKGMLFPKNNKTI